MTNEERDLLLKLEVTPEMERAVRCAAAFVDKKRELLKELDRVGKQVDTMLDKAFASMRKSIDSAPYRAAGDAEHYMRQCDVVHESDDEYGSELLRSLEKLQRLVRRGKAEAERSLRAEARSLKKSVKSRRVKTNIFG